MVPHGSLGKGSGKPTNLAKSFVLVSKVLTNSDTHGRIILPRVAVEANLSFLMGYRCASCKCACGSSACSQAAPRPIQSGVRPVVIVYAWTITQCLGLPDACTCIVEVSVLQQKK